MQVEALSHPGKPFRIKEVHDLTVDGMPADMPLGLTCRWPDGTVPKACVVFGHGLGESGRGYAEMSRYWAAHGYLVVHPTFADWIVALAAADPAIGEALEGRDPMDWGSLPGLRSRVIGLLHDPHYWLARVRMARAVTDAAQAIMAATCGAPPAPVPFAIAGHSFGAYLAQLLAGVEIDVPGQGPTRFRDERFAAAILLSGQGRDQQGLREGSWDTMACPMLNVTGTLDGGAKGQDWHWKCEPFDLAPPGARYLAVIEGAAHNLGGIARVTRDEDDAGQREAVYRLTLAFLDAHVAGDAGQRAWLASVSDSVGDCPVLFRRK
ncbi:MAG: hypothetical protein VYD64_06040 [Pseudomonadota bacterium]|nr:hypothetical protein [Pseudomonadota bacterium]